MKKWIYAVVAVCLLVYMCGGSDESDEPEYEKYSGYEQVSESSVSVDDSAPSWIQGKWVCTTSPVGIMTIEFYGNHYKESYGGEYYEGTYHIQDDAIMTSGSTYYLMDFERKKIYIESGYYYNKK